MSKEDGGPAFPVLSRAYFVEGKLIRPERGMSTRAYAAIKLRVPDSGIDWLDDMIRTSQRNELAGRALVGALSSPRLLMIDDKAIETVSDYALWASSQADALLAEGANGGPDERPTDEK